MNGVAIIVAGALAASAVAADESSTGTWFVAAQPGCSGSGKWEYTTDSNGVPALCIEASAHAVAYEVTGTATVYYATAGRKFYQAEYLKGKLNGQWQMWYPNGGFLSSGRFAAGDFAGIWTWLSSDGAKLQTVDWAKVLALAPTPLAAGYSVSDDETMGWYAEQIVRFGPYPDHVIAPYLATNASVVGEWGDLEHFFEFTRIKVSSATNGIYTVGIRSSGCLSVHVFTNRATFTAGVLRFDKPVCTYAAAPFRQAFLAGDPEHPRLFPETGLVALRRNIMEKGYAGARYWINVFGLSRVPETTPLQATHEHAP